MVLEFGHFGKQIIRTLKVLQCGVEEGWRRSVAPIVWKMKKYCIGTRRKGIFCVLSNGGRLTGLVTSCVGTAF